MLDIELKWLIVLLVNFLVLVYILNILMFRPLLGLASKNFYMNKLKNLDKLSPDYARNHDIDKMP